MTKTGAQKEVVRLQTPRSGLANADLELLRRIHRMAEVLAELIREYEAKPTPQNLESVIQWASELAELSARLRTISQEERSSINQAEENGIGRRYGRKNGI